MTLDILSEHNSSRYIDLVWRVKPPHTKQRNNETNKEKLELFSSPKPKLYAHESLKSLSTTNKYIYINIIYNI